MLLRAATCLKVDVNGKKQMLCVSARLVSRSIERINFAAVDRVLMTH